MVGRNKTQLLKFDLNATERNLESLMLVCFDILSITPVQVDSTRCGTVRQLSPLQFRLHLC